MNLKRVPQASVERTSDRRIVTATIETCILWVIALVKDWPPCVMVFLRHRIDKELRSLVGVIIAEKVFAAESESPVEI